MSITRRSFLSTVPAAGLMPASIAAAQEGQAGATAVPESFPAHDPAIAREMVAVSHGNVARVKELLSRRPALALATWDWGYGDWETALGAASHVGNREIAGLLLGAGAPPTLFSAAMMGQLDTLKSMIAASSGLQKTRGPHGITLLTHAKLGGATEVVKYLESIGDADRPYTNEPLGDADRTAILGSYAFGAASTERMVVSTNQRGALVMKREGAVDRNLFHLGARVFHPSGVEAVRIRFAQGERAQTVSIEDGDVVVTASRG